MKSVVVVGASGKMGQEILQVLAEKKIKAAACGSKTPLTKKTLLGKNLVIDFSSPEGLESALALCVELQIPLVSGTTGISDNQKKKLMTAAKKIPVLWSPNMSLGIALLKKSVHLLAKLEGFDFQVEEFHHRRKKDRPSGTALALQQCLTEALPRKTTLPEPIVMRAGGIVGIHKVYATSEEEMIVFEHQALNRRVFASGAVRAGEWLCQQKPGLYQMEDLFEV